VKLGARSRHLKHACPNPRNRRFGHRCGSWTENGLESGGTRDETEAGSGTPTRSLGALGELNCRVLGGAANNPLSGQQVPTTLARRGILYCRTQGLVPDSRRARRDCDSAATVSIGEPAA